MRVRPDSCGMGENYNAWREGVGKRVRRGDAKGRGRRYEKRVVGKRPFDTGRSSVAQSSERSDVLSHRRAAQEPTNAVDAECNGQRECLRRKGSETARADNKRILALNCKAQFTVSVVVSIFGSAGCGCYFWRRFLTSSISAWLSFENVFQETIWLRRHQPIPGTLASLSSVSADL